MGLDLTLGALVLIAAIRGWFKGFLLQALGLTALVSAVYLADPIRDFARPHAQEHLPAIQPELLDKLLWWVGGVLAAVVISGVGKGLIRASRRRSFGEPESRIGDQGAGFLLGGLKGAVVAAFLAAALSRHSEKYIQAGGYVEEQVKASQALAWDAQFKPAERIWTSTPVQAFVTRIKSRGLWSGPSSASDKAKEKIAETANARTSGRTGPLELPRISGGPIDPEAADFLLKLDRELRREGLTGSR